MAIALIFLGLVTWRLTYMLMKETGPQEIFTRFRAFLARKQRNKGGLYDLISCFLCLSLWVGLFVAAFIATNLLTWLMYALILSSEAIIIQRVFDRLKV